MSVQVFQQPVKPSLSLTVKLGHAAGVVSLADYIVDRHRTALGLNLAGIAADIGMVSQQDGGLGARIGHLIDAQLTPVERGQLLSGRFGQDLASPFVPPVLGPLTTRRSNDTPGVDRYTRAADITAIATPADAPTSLRFAANVSERFENLRLRSVPGGISKCQGGTLVSDPAGDFSLINEGGLGATAASFTPDLQPETPSRQQVRGLFLTLPFDRAEGSYTGMAMGGGSAAYLINSGQTLLVAQSGPQQFALVRTLMSPESIDVGALLDAHEARLARYASAGHSLPWASRMAAAQTAQSLSLVYYEGSGGSLTRR